MVGDRARILIGSFRKGDAEDPDVYASSVAAVLSGYPEDVVKRVTDPRTGLPGKCQWLPTVAEVKGACEAEMAPVLAEAARQERRAESERYFASPEAGRVSVARWKHLLDEIGHPSDKPTIAPKSEEWLCEYGRKPIAISDELRAQFAHEPQIEGAAE